MHYSINNNMSYSGSEINWSKTDGTTKRQYISYYGKLSHSDGFDIYLRYLSYGQSCSSNKYNSIQKKKCNDPRIMNYHMMKPSFFSLQSWRHCTDSCIHTNFKVINKKPWTNLYNSLISNDILWMAIQPEMNDVKVPKQMKTKNTRLFLCKSIRKY